MKLPSLGSPLVTAIVLILLGAFSPVPSSNAADAAATTAEPAFKRTEDVIYGRKFGIALTLDVFQPARSNGCAIRR